MIIPSNVEWYILQVTTILRELIKYYNVNVPRLFQVMLNGL
jgi:hypothetical protein